MLGCKTIYTPIEQNHKLSEAKDDEVVDKERYQKQEGKLLYMDIYMFSCIQKLFTFKLPRDISVSQNYSWKRKNTNQINEDHTDVDWAGPIANRRLTTRC
ncbi:nucleolar complex protein 2-like protein [Gossypium australe]|uniref:Nucleolar complex protein 2-like protein n=1 Tax=Gossypium australe TaxID=47621 RepID=A0A5B6VXF4_9ROSI|nr:nucleolar complex protein 2-like protein [Gossypium australe]